MSKQEHCPVCGKAKETNTYSCGGCGFPLAFVTKFSDKESYDLWSEQVKNAKQKLTNKKRKNLAARFRAAGGCTAYLRISSFIWYIAMEFSERGRCTGSQQASETTQYCIQTVL